MQHMPQSILAGLAGNVIEWYDFALYGFFALILSTLFFPADASTAGLLGTFGIFAAGFFMRPIGAAFFGYFGDVFGRRNALRASVTLMACATFAMGILPTYETVGIYAVLLLVLVRLLQGLSVGGEFSTSVTYMTENAACDTRGFVGSFANVGGLVGTLFGSAVAATSIAFIPHDILTTWGWRLPFLFGGVLGFLALWTRRNLPESPLFVRERTETQSPFYVLVHQNRSELLLGTLFAAGYSIMFYLLLIYLPTYFTTMFQLPTHTGLWINSTALLLTLPLIPLFGYISDRYIRRKWLIVFALGATIVLAPVLFLTLKTSAMFSFVAVQIVFALLMAIPLGCAPAFFVELFPTNDRLTAYSVAFNTGFALFGGTTPLIATWLLEYTKNPLAPAFYLSVSVIVALCAVLCIRDRSREPLR